MSRLSTDDIEFIERVTDEVQSSNALPFEIPQDRIPKIILKSAKFFWEWHMDATSEESLYIPSSAITAARDANTNARLQLPSGIEGILQLHTTGYSAGMTMRDALRIPLLDSYGASYRSSGQSHASGTGYGTNHWKVSDSVIAMYEYSMYKQTFRKGVRFSFNKNTSILNVLGATDGYSLVLSCFVRTPIEALYNDYRFEEHVTASVMAELGKIVTTFDFKLPGDVGINYDQLKSDGIDRKKEIEEELKGEQNAAGAIMLISH